MAGLPTNVGHGTVTGRFLSAEQVPGSDPEIDGVPMLGSVTFTPSVPHLLNASANVVIMGAPVTVNLDGTGAFTTMLVATDDPDLNPVDWTYEVLVRFASGQGQRLTLSIGVPTGGVVDLSRVVPVASSSGTLTVVGPQGIQGPQGVPGVADDASVAVVLTGPGQSRTVLDTTFVAQDIADINLKAAPYSAVGVITSDDTDAIERAFAAMAVGKGTGAAMHLPPGSYRITRPIVLPANSGGGRVAGAGRYVGDAQAGTRPGAQTMLVWDGPPGGTMFKQDGALGWEFENLTLIGRPTAAATNRAGIGYHCTRTGGFGAGVGGFRSVSFLDMDVAVQMGDAAGTASSADFVFDTCQWERVDTALLIKNTQGLNYRFESPSLVSCKRFVVAEQGGSVLVNMLNTAMCGSTDPNDWIFRFDNIADSTGNLIINGWRAEQNCKHLLKAATMGRVSILGFEEAQSDQAITQMMVRGVVLSLRDSRLISKSASGPFFDLGRGVGGQRGGLLLDNVHFDAPTWVFAEWLKFDNVGHDVAAQIKNSSYGDVGDRLPDLNTHLVWGPVTHMTQTSGATGKNAYLDGVASGNVYNVCRVPLNTTWLVDVYVVGQEVGGVGDVAAFHRRVLAKNVGGVVTLVGAEQVIGTDYNPGAWGTPLVTVVDAYDGLRTVVTGKAATVVNWKVRYVGARADAIG